MIRGTVCNADIEFMDPMKNSEIRQPAAEGRFYSGDKKSMFGQIRQIEEMHRYPAHFPGTGKVLGAVLPHAGHIFSGYQSVPFFQHIEHQGEFPDTFIIVHPNHSGMGASIALSPHKYWKTAAGKISIDKELAAHLPYKEDARAHMDEHSGEVIVPFIQYYARERQISILPVCMARQNHHGAGRLATALQQAVQATGRNVMILASSDFSHFLDADTGYKQDQYLLDEIYRKNIEGVENTVRKHAINACGYGPIMTLMAYAALEDPGYGILEMARTGNLALKRG